MELVILISVLATLGVVAVVVAIVVAFNKLNSKVDGHDLDRVYVSLHEISQDIDRRVGELEQVIGQDVNEVYRTIDSRCDKLYDLITNKTK